MRTVQNIVKTLFDNSIRRGRLYDSRMEVVSDYVWCWNRLYLIAVVGSLVMFDYISTYMLLEYSGKSNVCEGGVLASWALGKGSYSGLLLFDLLSLTILVITAITIRLVLFKYRFKGFGDLAFLVMLLPYALATVGAVANNVILFLL